jgi:PAS domain S-box-containing protein
MHVAKKPSLLLGGIICSYLLVFGLIITVQISQYRNIVNLTKQFNTSTEISVNKLMLLIDLRKETDSLQANLLHLLLQKTNINHNILQTYSQKVERNRSDVESDIHQLLDLEKNNIVVKHLKKLHQSWNANIPYVRQILRYLKNDNRDIAEYIYLSSQHDLFEKQEQLIETLTQLIKQETQEQQDRLAKITETKQKEFKNLARLMAGFLFGLAVLMLFTYYSSKKFYTKLIFSRQKYKKLIEVSSQLYLMVNADGVVELMNENLKIKLINNFYNTSVFNLSDILPEIAIIFNRNKLLNNAVSNKIISIPKTKLYVNKTAPLIVKGNFVLYYKQRKLSYAELYLNDFTENYLLQQQIKLSEKKYRNIFELSPLPKIIYDLQNLSILQVNHAAIIKYGYNKKEWLNIKYTDIFHPLYRDNVKEIVQNLRVKSEVLQGSTRHITKHGNFFDVEMRGVPFDYEGIPARMITVLDVTERNEAENKISKAIFDTQEKERFEISAELHDNVNQILTGAVFSLQQSLSVTMLPQCQQSLKSVQLHTRQAIETIRQISHRLAPPTFNYIGFSESLELLLNKINIHHQYSIEFVHNIPNNCKMPYDLMLILYRIVQENMNFIHQHAKATLIELSLNVDESGVELYMFDNGIGYDTKSVQNFIHFTNIQRRAALFSGYARIQSSPGNGCSVKVFIPLT